MTTAIHIDFETYSEIDLKKVGAWAYSKHPSTEVICMAYAVNSNSPNLWWPSYQRKDMSPVYATFPIADDVSDNEFHAFNSFFEYAIWVNVLKWPVPPIEQWVDTAAATDAACLPRFLDGVCAALGLPPEFQKDKRGTGLIHKLCKPVRGKRNRDPELLKELGEYCQQDVVAERTVSRRVRPLSDFERAVWLLDQRINIRGIGIDVGGLEDALAVLEYETDRLNARVEEITGGALKKVSERAKVMEFIKNEGFELENFQKGYLEKVHKNEKLTPVAKELIGIRLQLGKTSTAKYAKLKSIVDPDTRRAHGLLRYHGASTGRWSGNLFQPQNLPRGSFSDLGRCFDMFKARDHELIKMYYGDAMEALSSCVRGILVPGEGKKFIVADYSQIEARVVAWLAGQDNILKVFADDIDVYKYTASTIYKKPIDEITKDERFVGKTGTLSLGYQGGFRAFIGMAENYGVEHFDQKEAAQIVRQWREANPYIVSFWYSVEEAAVNAVKCPDHIFSVNKKATFKKEGAYLYCRLPSGRMLSYYRPLIEPKRIRYEDEHGDTHEFVKDSINFLGNDSVTKQFTRQSTYGGKLVENITQATARDIMAHAMLNLEKAGFQIALTVHDEIIVEAPTDRSLDEVIKIMINKPSWAEGLPVAADGFECERYRK